MSNLFPKFIFAILLCVAISGCATRPEANHFYFVQISDTHLRDDASFGRTEKVIGAINASPVRPECVVHTGDITMAYMENQDAVDHAKAVFAKLKSPVYLLPGNCDLYHVPNREKQSTAAYAKNFGPTCNETDVHGVVFITMDVEPICSKSARSEKSFDWLEAALRHAGDKPIILFIHIPPAIDFYENAFHEAWPVEQQQRLEKLLSAHNVKAIVAGHFHRDELHAIGSIPVFVSPSVIESSAYRLFEYTDGKLTYRTQTVE